MVFYYFFAGELENMSVFVGEGGVDTFVSTDNIFVRNNLFDETCACVLMPTKIKTHDIVYQKFIYFKICKLMKTFNRIL